MVIDVVTKCYKYVFIYLYTCFSIYWLVVDTHHNSGFVVHGLCYAHAIKSKETIWVWYHKLSKDSKQQRGQKN